MSAQILRGKTMLNVLIACEESQAVCKEFRRLGHRAMAEQWSEYLEKENNQ